MLAPAYGLIGYPLVHSFSPDYFKEKFAREGIDAAYAAFPLEKIDSLPALLNENPQLLGLNITTPHKQTVIRFLNSISEDAKAIGAVNCVAIHDKRLHGFNTDWTAFRDSLTPAIRPQHTQALVLGNGGAASAIRFALSQMNISCTTVSRKPEKGVISYEALSHQLIASYPIIINTTVLGTLGKGLPTLPYEGLTSAHLLYDLVYNPALTPFLARGLALGATIKNGLEMLQLQAESSWKIWRRFAS